MADMKVVRLIKRILIYIFRLSQMNCVDRGTAS